MEEIKIVEHRFQYQLCCIHAVLFDSCAYGKQLAVSITPVFHDLHQTAPEIRMNAV